LIACLVLVKARGKAEEFQVVKEKKGEANPRDRIVLAALTCIERDGIEATGIREIAREAGVNSAAINYYFQSKDKLLAIALERSLEQAFEEVLKDLDRAVASGQSLEEALAQVLEEYVGHATRYPRLSYAHLREALVHQRYDSPGVKRLTGFLEQLFERLQPAARPRPPVETRLALTQAWSSLVLLSLLPNLFTPFSQVNLDEPEHRRAYVRGLIRQLLG
jgi:AcrR family transcriptional regulator